MCALGIATDHGFSRCDWSPISNLRVSMGWSGLGLCPTHDRLDRIGWWKFRLAVDRRESQIGIIKRSVLVELPIMEKKMSKLFFSGENSPNLVEILPHLVRSLLKSGWDLPKSGINLIGSQVIWPKLAEKSLNHQNFVSLRLGWLMRVLEERTRQQTRRAPFLGFLTRR